MPLPRVVDAIAQAFPSAGELPGSIELQRLQDQLVKHPVFGSVQTDRDLRVFVEHQIWCVWDFMILGNAVATGVVGSPLVWFPPVSSRAVRLIRQILADEEADTAPSGEVLSHFEIFVRAARECGVPDTAFAMVRRSISGGTSVVEAMRAASAPEAACDFVSTTLELAQAPLPERLGAFCLGREVLVPSLISRLLVTPPLREARFPMLNWYAERHVEVDSTKHSVLAIELMRECVGTERAGQVAVVAGATTAIRARAMLLDRIHQVLA